MHSFVTTVSRRAKAILFLCAAGAAMPLAVAILPTRPPTLAWLLDLCAHWQWAYLIVGATCAIWLSATGAYAWSLPGTLLLAAGWFVQSPMSAAADDPNIATLTLITANLHAENNDPSALLRWAKVINADILVLQEVTPRTAAKIEKWDDYFHRIVIPQDGPFGLAVLSRAPLETPEAIEPDGQTLHVRVKALWDTNSIALGAVHPMPPLGTEYHARRVELFESVSLWATHTGLPTIIAGDFNASPWSSAMRPFTTHGLHRATGLSPTWPAKFPMIPIDQVVVSADWRVVHAEVGPQIGSDHRPVHVRLALPR